MSKDPLDRPATLEEIEMVERLLKRTRPAESVVPLRKSSTEVLALSVMPLLSPTRRKPENARAEPERQALGRTGRRAQAQAQGDKANATKLNVRGAARCCDGKEWQFPFSGIARGEELRLAPGRSRCLARETR